MNCEQCGIVIDRPRVNQRFCCDKCKHDWHLNHEPKGHVRAIRKLSRGPLSVTIHFRDSEALRVMRTLEIGSFVAVAKSES